MSKWEVIGWTCITIAILAGIAVLILFFISAKNIKNKRSELKNLHIELKPGMKVIFCGGIYGKLTKIGEEIVEIEVAKNIIIKVSRYSIQGIV